MPHDAVAQYRRWFEYEKDAHRKVLASLETVPAEGRSSPTFQKALDLLGHLVVARRMWLYRIGALAERPAQIFPTGVALESLPGDFEGMERAWDDYFRGLEESELDRVLEYRTTEGTWFRSRIVDILTQLHGHSLYHRGQVASLVKAGGGQPAASDFIYWSRESIPEPR